MKARSSGRLFMLGLCVCFALAEISQAFGQGTVVAWGGNASGQTTVPAGLSAVTAIAAGFGHTVALKGDGTVVAWGSNSAGQTTVPVGLNGVTNITAGYYHTVVVKSDGTVVAWGNNGSGQTIVPAGLSAVTAIAGGQHHTVAVKSDGTVVAWGRNDFGQTTVPAGLSGVVAIAAGDSHTVALRSDGTVVAWGNNSYGQRTVPADLSGVTAIAAGLDHTVALKSDGTVVAWGWNAYGQTTVPAGLTGVTAIAAGHEHTVALKNDGTVVAWGRNASGQTTIPADLSGVTAIAAGETHTVSLKSATLVNPPGISTQPIALVVNVTSNGTFTVAATGTAPLAYQWRKDGANLAGATATALNLVNVQTNQAGAYSVVITNAYGSTTSSVVALTVNQLSQTITFGALGNKLVGDAPFTVSATSSSGLPVSLSIISGPATLSGSTVTLTGAGTVTVRASQAGNATFGDATPVDRSFTVSAVGTVAAWGRNDFGQTAVPAGLGGVVAVAAGYNHNLALKNDGTVVAWGDSGEGRSTVPSGLSGVTAIASGNAHSLALKNDGTVVAWGFNFYGQATVPAGLSGVIAIAAGGDHTVALKSDGTVVAWGDNGSGQGNVPAGLSGVTAIAAGGFHNLALKNDGTIVAWGHNGEGRSTVPAGLSGVIRIAAGDRHSLALKNDGTVAAWGSGGNGETTTPGGLSGVMAIAGGGNHTVALKNDGTVVAWGYNGYGQTTIPPGLSRVTGISAGLWHTVVIDGRPFITGQPGSQTVNFDQTATFTVAAAGAMPLSYQWRKNGVNLNGATNASLELSNVQVIQAGSYTVVITNPYGSATSSVASLTVQGGPPNIATQPVSINSPATTIATFSVVATGTTPFGYQWRKDGVDLSGAIGDTLTLSNVQVSQAGNYTVVITNVYGSATSSVAVLTVQEPPGLAAYYQLNGNANDASGNAKHGLAVNALGTADRFGNANSALLFSDTDSYINLVTNRPLTGETAGLTISGWFRADGVQAGKGIFFHRVGNADIGIRISHGAPMRLEFVTLYGTTSVLFSSATLPTNAWVFFAVTYDGTFKTIYLNGQLDVTAPHSGNLNWDVGSLEGETISGNFPGQAEAFRGALDDIRIYNRGLTSNEVSSLYWSAPFIVSQPLSSAASVASNLSFNITTDGPGPLAYQWRKDGVNLAGATAATLNLVNVQFNQAGAYSVVITNAYGSTTSSVVALTVNQLSQTITFGALANKLVGDAPFTVSATSSSGLPVNLSIVSGPATLSGSTVTLTGAGTVIVRASQVGNATYNAAPPVDRSFTVSAVGTVAAWGRNDFGQTAVPAGLSGVVAVAGGYYHTVALKSDGTVLGWGRNNFGQTSVPAGLSGVTAIAAGGDHTVALKSDGTVVAWGNNFGQTSVPAGLGVVTAIAAGGDHTVALKSDGTVVGWGNNSYGQRSSPAGLSGVTTIAAGLDHTVALKSDGTVVAWGWNAFNQTTVPAGLSGATAIVAGLYHTVALKSDGTVVAWGGNSFGQSTGGWSGVTAIAAGGEHTVAIGLVPPSITAQPVSLTVAAASSNFFSVGAAGTDPLNYQWRKDGLNLSGETSAVLILSNVQTNQSGSYTVIITNAYGSVTSNPAVLEVQVPPQITQTPVPLVWVEGVEAKLSVGAAGSSLAYIWLKNGSPISGADRSELVLDAFSTIDGAKYSVQVFNTVGNVISPEVRVILPSQTNTIPSLVVRPANAPVLTFDGIDPVAGRILRGGITKVVMGTAFPSGSVFYTLDGSEPIVGGNAREYIGPFYLYDSCNVRAVAVDQLFVSQVAVPTVSVEIRPLYPVEAFSKGGGVAALGTPAYSGKLYVSNTLVSATATASNGWSLLNWNSANGAVAAGTNIAVRATSGTRLEAVFGTVLTTVGGGAGSGTIEASPLLALYPYGAEVKLLARPQSGSYLFRWQPSATVQNPISVTVTNAGITNSAVFSSLLNGYVSLVADVVGSGQVAQNPLQGQYLTGSAVTLTAMPAAQHRFVRWQGDIAAASNPLNLSLSVNTSIQAVFEPDVRIVHEPAARDVVVGATAIFSVGATGPGTLAYQWRKNGQPLSGETGVVLAVRTTPGFVSSVYDVVVTSGATSVTSAGASMRVYAPRSVSAWGLNTLGPLAVPIGLTNASVVGAGTTHSLAVDPQGAVVAWGDSAEGKLVVPQALAGVASVAAGSDFSLAADRLGRVYAWGRNNFGQLNLPLALLNAVQLAAGNSFAVGLNASGEVVAWGRNDFGQTNVPAGLVNAAAVAAGGRHAVALRSDGTVVAWGADDLGQATVPAGLTNILAVSAGGDFCLALRRDGTVVGWGNNAEGQTAIPSAATNVQAIACGVDHSLALRADGSFLAWGRNDQGQLNFPPNLTNAVVISANSRFSVAISRGHLLRVLVPQRLDILEKLAGGNFKLRFSDADGGVLADVDKPRFIVQWSTNFAQWFDLTNPTRSVVNGKVELVDTDTADRARQFYRVIER